MDTGKKFPYNPTRAVGLETSESNSRVVLDTRKRALGMHYLHTGYATGTEYATLSPLAEDYMKQPILFSHLL